MSNFIKHTAHYQALANALAILGWFGLLSVLLGAGIVRFLSGRLPLGAVGVVCLLFALGLYAHVRMSAKRTIFIGFIVVATALFGVIAFPFVRERMLWPNPSDPRKATGIARYVADHFSFTQKSKQRPDSPPIYNNIDSWLAHPTVVVYTITDKQQQDRILDLVRQYKEQEGLGTIMVNFYREENWSTWSTKDGGECGGRGREELLRSERIK